MDRFKLYTCCFFGHRKIIETDKLKLKLYSEIESLITSEKVHTFLFGSKSQFNDLCYKVVTELKEKYSYIKRIYVRAEFPYISEDYKDYLLERYDDSYYPTGILNAGRTVYIERNYEMIDNSEFCIIYYNKEYSPPERKGSKVTFGCQAKSGTSIAYQYAERKNKKIINILNI